MCIQVIPVAVQATVVHVGKMVITLRWAEVIGHTRDGGDELRRRQGGGQRRAGDRSVV